MAKLALTFIVFVLLSLAFAEPTKTRCPENVIPYSPSMGCSKDMAYMCVFYKDGSASQYRGPSSCVCEITGAESYYRGQCTEKDALLIKDCSFLSLAVPVSTTQPVKHKCPQRTGPPQDPRMRRCTMDVAIMCTTHRDGSIHQYEGSSSCLCSNEKVDTYYRGWCSEEHRQAAIKRSAENQKKYEQEANKRWSEMVNKQSQDLQRMRRTALKAR